MRMLKVFSFLVILLSTLFLFQNCQNKKTFSMSRMQSLVPLCRDVSAAEVAPKLKWDWIKLLSVSPDTRWPGFDQVMAAPMVADLDGDKVPEVVFMSFSKSPADYFSDTIGTLYARNGVLRIVDGATGLTKKSVGEQNLAPWPSQSPLLIDLDHDGKVEIVYLSYLSVAEIKNGAPVYNPQSIIALNYDGSLRWKFTLDKYMSILAFSPSGFTASDVNNDGLAEILVGSTLITETASQTPVVVWRLPAGTAEKHTSVVYSALDPDRLDVTYLINHNGVYDQNGNLKFKFNGLAYGIAVGDIFPENHGLEIVTTYSGRLSIYNGVTGAELSTIDMTQFNDFVCPSGRIGGGPATIGDFDGNPATLEIGVATGRHLTIFDKNSQPIYKFITQDCSSLVTGLTSYDLNGDKKAEILYSDEEYLRIYEVTDGVLQERHKIVNPTGTLLEYPVVADIDGNMTAEILVVSNNYPAAAFYKDPSEVADLAEALHTTGVRAFTSTGENGWMPTRSLWNQYSFHPDQFTDQAQLIPMAIMDPNIYRSNNQGEFRNLKCKN